MSHHVNQTNLKEVLVSQPWELCALSVSIATLGALTMLGDSLTMFGDPLTMFGHPLWLLSLLAIGVAQALLLATPYSLVGGLAVSAAWVLMRQSAGLEPPQHLLEVLGVMATIAMAIRYRGIWQEERAALQELRALRGLLVDGEAGTGLVSRSVAELRLLEESERAETSQRPLGVLLIEINNTAHPGGSDHKFRQASKAIERKLVNLARSYDLPFRAQENRIGLILPERDWQSLQNERASICEAVRHAVFVTQIGQPEPAMNHVRLGIGWSEYGQTTGIELLTMAERSLQPKRTLILHREHRQHTSPSTQPITQRIAVQKY
ncbi:MAG: diguanylate cyclase domain-containing protein, partial [Ardenticatenaceae bacterium]